MTKAKAHRGSGSSAVSEIKALEDHLEELRKQRMQKDVALMKQNEKLIARDAERHARFVAEYKSKEQVESERREEILRMLTDKLADVVNEEDDSRELVELEEMLTHRIMTQEHHLALVCLTLAVVHYEYDRKEFQKKLLEEECSRKARAYDKLKETLKSEEFTMRKGIEKMESNDFREFRGMWKKGSEQASLAEHQRLERSLQESQQVQMRQLESDTTKLQQEVEEAEAALANKLERLSQRYASMGS